MTALSDATLAAIWIASMLLLVTLTSMDALREMFPRRRDFLSRLALTHFYRMLARRHIAVTRYLEKTAPSRIAAHIRSCDTCACKRLCERVLQSGECRDYSFCPSDRDVARLSR